MNLKETGSFIQQLRKEKGLTQSALALKLGVSEKTISKWECGNGFPDTTLMLPLCKELGISANELLSAKKLQNEKEYKETAEDNLVVLKGLHERYTRLLLMIEWPLAVLSLVILLGCVFLASYGNLEDVWRVVLIIVGFGLGFYGLFFATVIEAKAGYYECNKCHHKHIPSCKSVFWAMHVGRTRHMKCPKCGETSWQRKKIHGD